MALPSLPWEILSMIVARCNQTTLKQIRLCCKHLEQEAVQHLFAAISFETRPLDLERVCRIANNSSKIAGAVKSLELRETAYLEGLEIEDFQDWCTYFGSWDSDDECNELVDEDMILQLSDSKEQENKKKLRFLGKRLRLYRELMAQSEEPSLYECLHEPGPSVIERMHIASSQGLEENGTIRQFQQACVGFEEALPKLSNLQRFTALSPILEQDWQDVDDVDRYNEPGISDRVAPLAFVLRALGRRSSISSSLISLDLNLHQLNPVWSLENLEDAWSSTDVDRNQGLVEDAFVHLTDLHLSLCSTLQTSDTFQALARIINKARKLVRLTLSLMDFCWEDWKSPDILDTITTGPQWPMLEKLRLEGAWFQSNSLLCTLTQLAPTLKSLELIKCILPEDEDSWLDVYQQLRLMPLNKLHYLDFRNCGQSTFDHKVLSEPPGSWSSKDVRKRLMVMHFMDRHRVGFSSEIYDYILKQTNTMPPLRLYSYESTETLARREASRHDPVSGFREIGYMLLEE